MLSSSPGLNSSFFAISLLIVGCSDAGTIGGTGGEGGMAQASSTGSTDSVASSTTAQSSAATTSSASGTGGAPPLMELLHEEGRFDTTVADKPRFTWPGTSIGARFTGGCQAIKVNLDVDLGVPQYKIWFQVEIDGSPTTKFVTNQGSASYAIASQLSANGMHDVRIIRINEGWLGKVSFVSFEPTGCAQVESPVPHIHAIEYIGDSTTCGYGDEGAAPCSFTAETENAYETYASITARNLDASAHFIAYSGKGVYQNSDGGKTQVMPELYLRTLWNDASATYDFSLYDPDLVVLNLGTNDFSHPIDDQTFIDAYKSMLAEIRQRRPNATIVCIIWSKWGAAHDALVTQAVNDFGDAKVLTTVFDRLPTEPSGCDGHPTVMTHARLGNQLTTFIQANLGW